MYHRNSSTLEPYVKETFTLGNHTVRLDIDDGVSGSELDDVMSDEVGFVKTSDGIMQENTCSYRILANNETDAWLIRIGGKELELGQSAKIKSILLDGLLREYANSEVESDYKRILGTMRNTDGYLLAIIVSKEPLM